tara:strand:+ start:1671 stop:2012 length:342 start_codon:yes stop_codon:yes gene_type:complete
MPNFKKDRSKFTMKGFSPFNVGTPYKANGNEKGKTVVRRKLNKTGATEAATERIKMQDKVVPTAPKKPKVEPLSNKKKRLEKEGKTNTQEYKDLIKKLETGPGSYGNEEWDKE